MAEVLQMANRVLPLSVAAKIQAGYLLIDANDLTIKSDISRPFLEYSAWPPITAMENIG